MIPPPIPRNEKQRLESLHALNILDTPAEERFDRITRLAQRLFEVPIVGVSLIDEARQWFKSIQGLEQREIARSASFCAHAILSPEPLIVEDTLEDERFGGNPLVTGEPRIRFYAGQPIAAAEGGRLGTLCLMDTKPRSLSDQDRIALGDLATFAENELNMVRMSRAQMELLSELQMAQKQALLDGMTWLWNREGIVKVLERELAHAGREGTQVSVLVADLDHFAAINDRHGRDAGDSVLKEVVRRMRAGQRASDMIGRVGGEEFLFVLPACGLRGADRVAERVRSNVAAEPVILEREGDLQPIRITISVGAAEHTPETPLTADRLLESARHALNRAKKKGRNRVELSHARPAAAGEGTA